MVNEGHKTLYMCEGHKTLCINYLLAAGGSSTACITRVVNEGHQTLYLCEGHKTLCINYILAAGGSCPSTACITHVVNEGHHTLYLCEGHKTLCINYFLAAGGSCPGGLSAFFSCQLHCRCLFFPFKLPVSSCPCANGKVCEAFICYKSICPFRHTPEVCFW